MLKILISENGHRLKNNVTSSSMNLLKWKWYRNLFSNKTFVKSDGIWINIKKYLKGKIIDVDGKWTTQAFCSCGNELVCSNSFIQERKTQNHYIFDYKCSNCGKIQYWNPDIISGLLPCQFDGTPI